MDEVVYAQRVLRNLADAAREVIERHGPSGGAPNLCTVCLTTWRCRAVKNAVIVLEQFGEEVDLGD